MSTNKQRGLLVFIGTSVTTTLVSAFTKSDNYLSLLEVPVLSRATTISLLLNLCVCVTCVCYHRVRTQHGVSTSAENRQKRGDVEILNYLQDAAGSRNLVFDLSVREI